MRELLELVVDQDGRCMILFPTVILCRGQMLAIKIPIFDSVNQLRAAVAHMKLAG